MIGTVRKMVEFLESCIPVFPDDEDLDTAIKEGRALIDQLREAQHASSYSLISVADFFAGKPLPDSADVCDRQQPAPVQKGK